MPDHALRAASGSASRWPGPSPSSPRLLLLDEPLSALDRGLRERLAAELRDILRAAGATALLVTHDHDEAFAVADRMAVMREGRIVQTGTLDEVWSRPADGWTAAFLGYATVLAGEPARRLRELAAPTETWEAVALRRSALRVDPDGPAARARGGGAGHSRPDPGAARRRRGGLVARRRGARAAAIRRGRAGACVHRHVADRARPRGRCQVAGP